MKTCFGLCIISWCLVVLPVVENVKDAPRSLDSRLEVRLFAQQPDIVHPVALAFDHRGRLLVIESHTHFRPANYTGPKHDRIRVLEDTDGDGKADKYTTFFEGTTASMDMAVHPDDSVYLATRKEILRLRDTDGDGKADSQERLMHLDTLGDYPHNGLSGLAFDSDGNLYFGMGENLGVKYRLIGNDGIVHADGGEGGNVFWCTRDGNKLRRVATGFWNPFGIYVDTYGRILAIDNDPDSTPPCRLLHVVEGGDYGYQFRYGRSGKHPFQAWNGQLAGTLPMIAGTGEAPCEIIRYEHAALPAEYYGTYLVTSWADHRLERYDLNPKGASFSAEQKIVVQGSGDFRPTGLATAHDGSLYIGDWVKSDYNLHGKGAIWQVRPVKPQSYKSSPTDELQQRDLQKNMALKEAQWVRQKRLTGKSVSEYLDGQYSPLVCVEALPSLTREQDIPALLKFLTHPDPFIQQAARLHLSQTTTLLDSIQVTRLNPETRLAVLLAQQASKTGRYQKYLVDYLTDPDEDIRFYALKWVSDLALKEYEPQLQRMILQPSQTVRLSLALATALARIQDKDVTETHLANQLLEVLKRPDTTEDQQLQALRLIPPSHPPLSVSFLEELLKRSKEQMKTEIVLTLCLHPAQERKPALERIASDTTHSKEVRNWARQGLLEQTTVSLPTKDVNLPGDTDIDAWLKLIGTGGNSETGRQVFYHPQKAGCYRCHAVNGRGSVSGPDLSVIGRVESKRILESLLQPSATVAPHFQNWILLMHDGRTLQGMLIRTYLDEYTYLDQQGKTFTVKTEDIAETKASSQSLMPQGLLRQLSLQDARDLFSFLLSCK